ncbi:MAG: tRNA (adenosine(37)-N6)-dimethylallyltransferase MiaA [Lachnospiraceae bacterium]|nr:tRNA (adenosine(37)-N6)-dimethylallyltransferase MiaA [Lachnospiraceae bacterium]
MNKPLVILTGPTAVGKTEYSIKLAKKINGEIISADSIQVYKYMDIGSAKVTKEEMSGVQHYLIDELYPDEDFNIDLFQQKCKQYIEEIYSKGKVPIIAGGTGFYIQSVLYDIKFEDTQKNQTYRDELEEYVKANGAMSLHDKLRQVDPKAAEKIHFNNVKRVIRALEYYKETGNKISEHNEEQRLNESPYNFAYIVLSDDREKMYERINKRVDIMIEQGLVNEVQTLLNMGYKKDLVSMQGIGYKEIIQYIEGDISLDQAIYDIKINTRHFAKRQLTWFRREKNIDMIYYPDFNYDKELILDNIIKITKNRTNI